MVFSKDIKLEHSIFALPFAYSGLILAEGGLPRASIFLWITLAMVNFRTMAMAINRFVDRNIDAKNPRTCGRALPQKQLSARNVLIAIVASFIIFEYSAVKLGALCVFLSPIPVILTWVYPYAKRVTYFSHFILGLILGIAPYGAWIASRGTYDFPPLFLTLGVTFWVAGFDMIYALQDIEFDHANNLFSFPAKWGREVTLTISRILHIAAVLFWISAGFFAHSGIFYFAGIFVISGFLIREHSLTRSFSEVKINEAFFTMNAVVSVLFFIAVFCDEVF